MKRFLITAPGSYSGAIDVHYDDQGMLVRFDVGETNLKPHALAGFKEKVPVWVADLSTAFKAGVTVQEAQFEVSFEDFWRVYNKKINKARCLPLWARLLPPEQVRAVYGVKPYDRYLQKHPHRPKADPEKYLKDKYWENEWM